MQLSLRMQLLYCLLRTDKQFNNTLVYFIIQLFCSKRSYQVYRAQGIISKKVIEVPHTYHEIKSS